MAGATTDAASAWLEQAPGWFARFAAWALPSEQPGPEALDEAALAAAELWVGRDLARALAGPDELPFAVEAVLRASAADPFDVGAWLGLHAVLVDEGLAEVTESSEPTVQAAAEALCCAPTLPALLEAAGAGELPSGWLRAVDAALEEALGDGALCWVHGIDGDGPGRTGRRFVGTAHARLQALEVADARATDHVVWCDDNAVVVFPHWIAHWDAEHRTLRWFHGRGANGTQYRGWSGAPRHRRIPEDAPVFLQEDRLATPDPSGVALPSTLPDPTPSGAGRHSATLPMARPRRSVPPGSVPATADGAPHPFVSEDPLVLRVLTTRYVLRYVRLEPGADITIGRNSDDASFVLAHHQLSRAHTRVRYRDGVIWVSDLGSTNGTQLNDQEVGRAEVPAAPGDIVAAGPVLLRIEHVPEAHLARMEVVTGLRPSPDRDPLTRLLLPKHLAEHLPEALQGGFQEGSVAGASDAPSLWGVLLRIDRLHAMHAQLGQSVADAAFAITARLVQGYAPDPLSVVRVGYGELLVPLIGVDEAGARNQAADLVRVVREQPWEPPLSKVTVTGGIGEKRPEEGASVWVARIRAGLPSPS